MLNIEHILLQLHLGSILPCIFLGAFLLIRKKSGPIHRLVGKIYMSLMLFTAAVSLFLPADVGPKLFLHFGWLNLLSLLTLWTVPSAYFSIRKGDVRAHKVKMISLYIGAILIAGGFTLVPGRYLHELFFSH